MTLGRQRFSLAHEFYHLYFDENMISVCAKKIGSGNETEREADRFASYFLMPEAGLLTLAEDLVKNARDRFLTLNDLIRIEQYYGISHQAAVYRLRRTPYLAADRADLIYGK